MWVISSLEFNGISIIYTLCWSSPDEVFTTDACLTGCGGCSGSKMFHKEFSADVLVQFPFIHQLECLAMLVAIRLWGSAWKGQRLTVFCDNEAVVQVLNSGKTRDALLGKLLRNIWLVSSTHEFELRAVHLPGIENRVADLLSRWHLNPEIYYSAQLHAQSSTSIQYHTEDVNNTFFELKESFWFFLSDSFNLNGTSKSPGRQHAHLAQTRITVRSGGTIYRFACTLSFNLYLRPLKSLVYIVSF